MAVSWKAALVLGVLLSMSVVAHETHRKDHSTRIQGSIETANAFEGTDQSGERSSYGFLGGNFKQQQGAESPRKFSGEYDPIDGSVHPKLISPEELAEDADTAPFRRPDVAPFRHRSDDSGDDYDDENDSRDHRENSRHKSLKRSGRRRHHGSNGGGDRDESPRSADYDDADSNSYDDEEDEGSDRNSDERSSEDEEDEYFLNGEAPKYSIDVAKPADPLPQAKNSSSELEVEGVFDVQSIVPHRSSLDRIIPFVLVFIIMLLLCDYPRVRTFIRTKFTSLTVRVHATRHTNQQLHPQTHQFPDNFETCPLIPTPEQPELLAPSAPPMQQQHNLPGLSTHPTMYGGSIGMPVPQSGAFPFPMMHSMHDAQSQTQQGDFSGLPAVGQPPSLGCKTTVLGKPQKARPASQYFQELESGQRPVPLFTLRQ